MSYPSDSDVTCRETRFKFCYNCQPVLLYVSNIRWVDDDKSKPTDQTRGINGKTEKGKAITSSVRGEEQAVKQASTKTRSSTRYCRYDVPSCQYSSCERGANEGK
ncbi:hypothetical protein Naga_100387g2 [Nannochloropsis gaditana]|uniref:Uncharacterized protein n=1 Tax=Nannochloropsis gaditana TaxID=72520 RepID=W7TF93_9STRA|nr:hypothetical protein Naga_100387g2 [Nannochloropsis gaditana]